MLIYDALKHDHETIKSLLRQLEASSPDAIHVRHDLLEQLRSELIAHSRAEEKVFYDTLKEISGTDDLALEGYEEHSMNESLLRELEIVNPSEERWKTKVHALRESIEHHLADEEGEMFAAAQQVLAPEEARMMGEAYKNLRRQIQDGSMLHAALETVAQYMPARFASRFMALSLRR